MLQERKKEALSVYLMMQKRGSVLSKATYHKIMELLLAEILTDLALKLFEDMLYHGYNSRYSNY